jgi:hypothetical protein
LFVVVKMKRSLRKYRKWDLLNRVVNASGAEVGPEKMGWWFAVHFEQKFVVGLDVRVKDVEGLPMASAR